MSAIEKLEPAVPLEGSNEAVEDVLFLSLDPIVLSANAVAKLREHGIEIVEGLIENEPAAAITPPKPVRLDEYRRRKAVDQPVDLPESSPFINDFRRVVAARTDEQIFAQLYREHENFLRLKASAYFVAGGDSSDLIQEAALGFYKAVRDYDGLKSPFGAFVQLCVTRQIITAVKTANRFKHEPLNQYVSFAFPFGSDSPDAGGVGTLEEALASKVPDVDELVVGNDELAKLVHMLGTELSFLEAESLRLFLEEKSYNEIAEELNVDCRSVDNALQRVKRKVIDHQKEEDLVGPYTRISGTRF